MSASSGALMDAAVQPAIAAFIQTGSKKVGEKVPWILFDVGKKEKGETKDTIKIVQIAEAGKTYDDLVQVLLDTEAAYALADYTLSESEKKTVETTADAFLVFISWTKDSAPIKKKMVASASVAPIRNLLSKACKVLLESHDFDDICPETMFKHVKKCYKL